MNGRNTIEDLGPWPEVWGQGALFGFSGLDGPTVTAGGFVATYHDAAYDLLFHTPRQRVLCVRPAQPGKVRCASGDVLWVQMPGRSGPLVLAWSAWHTLAGVVPTGTALALAFRDGTAGERAGDGDLSLCHDHEQGDCLALARDGKRLALSYGSTAAEAAERARAGLAADLDQVVADRLAFLAQAPRLPAAADNRLLRKCLSVMKVNALWPEGAIDCLWSTPDRVPHRHLWLWDSVFHSFAMNRLKPAAAWSYLRAVLRTARPDGMIPHCTQVSGRQSDITQPPILAWGVWENFQHTRDRAALEWALPRLEKYLVWDVENRDTNGNGLLEWRGGRGDESGLDNSQRFDSREWLDAVDFSVFAAHDMNCLAQIALALGQPERARRWNYLSRLTAREVHERLWQARDGFYYDRHFDGRLSPVKAVTGFLPLLLDSLLYERVDRLLAMLQNPAHFASACPVPSVALSTPGYGTDMWRGATWLNTNWLVIEGLRRRRRPDAAAALAQATLDLVRRHYQESGVIFEFYDSSDRLPPSRCDRKGPHRPDLPYDFRRKYDSIRDYHWSAAVTAMLLLDGRE